MKHPLCLTLVTLLFLASSAHAFSGQTNTWYDINLNESFKADGLKCLVDNAMSVTYLHGDIEVLETTKPSSRIGQLPTHCRPNRTITLVKQVFIAPHDTPSVILKINSEGVITFEHGKTLTKLNKIILDGVSFLRI